MNGLLGLAELSLTHTGIGRMIADWLFGRDSAVQLLLSSMADKSSRKVPSHTKAAAPLGKPEMRSDDHRTSRSQPLILDATSSAADWSLVGALCIPVQLAERLLSVQSAINRAVNVIAYASARLHRMRS